LEFGFWNLGFVLLARLYEPKGRGNQTVNGVMPFWEQFPRKDMIGTRLQWGIIDIPSIQAI